MSPRAMQLCFLAVTLCSSLTSAGQQWRLVYGSKCVSPYRQPGVCTKLSECENLNKLFSYSRRMAINANTYWQKSLCGFEGHVPILCCPGYKIWGTGKTNPTVKPTAMGTTVGTSMGTTVVTPVVTTMVTAMGTSMGTTVGTSMATTMVTPVVTTMVTARATQVTTAVPATKSLVNNTTSSPTTVAGSAVSNVTSSPLPHTTPPTVVPPTASSNSPPVLDHVNRALLPEQCGEVTHETILGGVNAFMGEYPWLAVFEYISPAGSNVLCGGALINSRHVVTAAHCIDTGRANVKLKSVHLGDHDITKDPDCVTTRTGEHCADPVLKLGVESYKIHPRYSKLTQANDIALVRLTQAVQFSVYIRPICVPSGALLHQDFTGSLQTVAGWGHTGTLARSAIKQVVRLPVISNEECARNFSGRVAVDDTLLCAGGERGKDSCTGDSGGPLMLFTDRWYITGVVSAGPFPCGMEGKPGVYVRVSSYVPWILDNLKP